jgi:glycosyltransferase involved in cell wall biosynthesis
MINELSLQQNVTLLGYHKDPNKYYGRANCFVSTSLSEGFPNVFLEAMSAGLPIVCLDTNFGPREILLKPIVSNHADIQPISNVYQHESFSILNPSLQNLAQTLASEIHRLQQLHNNAIVDWSDHLRYFSKDRILPEWANSLSL